MSNELTVVSPASIGAAQMYERIADPIEAIATMGEWFARSGMFGCEKSEQGQILALAAFCERKSPIEIADTYYLVGGRLLMKSSAQLAKYRGQGGKVKWLTTNEKKCEAEFNFEGSKQKVSFTIEEAKTQGLLRPNSGWAKDPAAMLRARTVTRAIKMLCPEILIGGSGDDFDSPPPQPAAPAPNPIAEATTGAVGTSSGTPGDKNAPKSRSEERAKARQDEAEKAKKPRGKAKSTPKSEPLPPQEPSEAKMSDSTVRKASEAVQGESEPVDVESEVTQEDKAAAAIDKGVGSEAPDWATSEQVQAVMTLCDEQEEGFEAAADAWLVARKLIPKSGAINRLLAKDAAAITETPDRFVKAVKRLAAKAAKK